MNLKLSSVPYFSTFLHSSITIPKQWINDIKFVEFNEILSSSVSALALLFRWNKLEKSEKILKIGLALSCQKINKVPTDKFDKKMNYIFTESKIYK